MRISMTNSRSPLSRFAMYLLSPIDFFGTRREDPGRTIVAAGAVSEI